jgi:hypothetical protein
MKMNKFLWIAMAGLLSLNACKKDDPQNVNKVDITGKTNKEVLMIQPWAFHSYTQTTNGNVVDAMDACQKDDVFIFKANDLCDVRTNSIKCYPGEPDTWETPWTMPSATGDLVNFFTMDFNIKNKSNIAVTLERKYENRSGVWVTETVELRASK